MLTDAKTALLYEELRSAIDGGHESMTHADALAEISAILAENETLRAGYDAARLEIESLQARIKTMAEEHADELMVAHLDGGMRAAQQPSPTPQADSQLAPVRDERDDFEKVFPLPSGCIRVGTGYASTGYCNWAAHTHCERWQGWQARAARAPADSVTAPAGAGVAHALSNEQIEAMPVWRNFVGLWPKSRREIVDAVVDLLTAPPTQAADSVTASSWASHEKELEDALRERDESDEFIDTLLDEVLGADRAEWSSAYGRADALNDVQERMTTLHKPTVDKAWGRF